MAFVGPQVSSWIPKSMKLSYTRVQHFLILCGKVHFNIGKTAKVKAEKSNLTVRQIWVQILVPPFTSYLPLPSHFTSGTSFLQNCNNNTHLTML